MSNAPTTPLLARPLAEVARRLLLTPREAAETLAISPRTLWGLTAPRGPIRAVRFGRCLRYDVRDLAAFIEQQKGGRQ